MSQEGGKPHGSNSSISTFTGENQPALGAWPGAATNIKQKCNVAIWFLLSSLLSFSSVHGTSFPPNAII